MPAPSVPLCPRDCCGLRPLTNKYSISLVLQLLQDGDPALMKVLVPASSTLPLGPRRGAGARASTEAESGAGDRAGHGCSLGL